ncbi:hypothetical protein ES702_00413 [subsurface metagenome]
MSDDPFDGLLDLEQEFYQEGYDAGLADGQHAGFVEGKVFGMEKGYEKALELGRLHGRALIWQTRSQQAMSAQSAFSSIPASTNTSQLLSHLDHSTLPKNSRLNKHIEGLLSATDTESIAIDNSDEAVTEFDDRIAKAQAKAKVIAAIVNEPLKPETGTSTNIGIEDAQGLNARH